MNAIPILRNGQITLPAKLRQLLNLEAGDYLEPQIKNKTIILKPKKLIDLDQAWFWTKEWQEKEREADEDIAQGRIKGPFDNFEDLIKDLEK